VDGPAQQSAKRPRNPAPFQGTGEGPGRQPTSVKFLPFFWKRNLDYAKFYQYVIIYVAIDA
jgi:hypothetical protein